MKDNVIVIQIIYVLKNVKYKVVNKKVDSVGSQSNSNTDATIDLLGHDELQDHEQTMNHDELNDFTEIVRGKYLLNFIKYLLKSI